MIPRIMIRALLVLAAAAAQCDYNDDSCIVIVACGDSITRGGHGTKGWDWPELVQNELGDNYLVINRGVGGSTLTDFTDRAWIDTSHGQEALEQSAKANAFVVALGTNDAKSGGDDPIWPLLGPHDFADAYEHVLEELRDAADQEPIMFVATPIPAKNPSGKWPDVDILNVEMPPLIEGIAHDNDAILIDAHLADFYDVHGDVDPQFYDDSVHPNDAGYKLIASAVADAIRQQFPAPSPRPTHKPSYAPSSMPSSRPSPRPTSLPSASPTPRPTTPAPSPAPSQRPTQRPSAMPSSMPSSMPTLVPRASSTKQDEPVSAAGAAVGTVLGAFVLVGSYVLVQGFRKLRRKKERVQGALDSPPPPPRFSPPGDEKGLLSSPDNWWRKRLAGGTSRYEHSDDDVRITVDFGGRRVPVAKARSNSPAGFGKWFRPLSPRRFLWKNSFDEAACPTPDGEEVKEEYPDQVKRPQPRRPTEATDVFAIEMSPRSHSPTPTDSSFGESLGESDVVVVALDVDSQSARSESPPLEPSPTTPPTSPLQKLMKSVSNSVLGKNSWAKTQASPAAQHARRRAWSETDDFSRGTPSPPASDDVSSEASSVPPPPTAPPPQPPFGSPARFPQPIFADDSDDL